MAACHSGCACGRSRTGWISLLGASVIAGLLVAPAPAQVGEGAPPREGAEGLVQPVVQLTAAERFAALPRFGMDVFSAEERPVDDRFAFPPCGTRDSSSGTSSRWSASLPRRSTDIRPSGT